jgi:hypothetical protein
MVGDGPAGRIGSEDADMDAMRAAADAAAMDAMRAAMADGCDAEEAIAAADIAWGEAYAAAEQSVHDGHEC